ncbi:L-lactate dehydrogenase [Terasakiispira papahanaumokuakeensis]|uniref:L-lactate dehydrogenase n=2 Tax=Terasakiispira papahanaumokuakeensis TaxID=197479 RepID=A0A1E2VA38_9GAMM|nr:L-lactate dehydrogenase [Terasakiispira papahanaumokuakeensis]
MKIAVIGAGMVGISICDYLLLMGNCAELVLVDINQERAAGEIMDFSHTTALSFSKNTRLVAGDYSDCRGADIVIITAGAQIQKGQTRDQLASTNARVAIDIAKALEPYAPNATLILVSNPVDITAYFVIAHTGYLPHQVISSGCIIDSARLMTILGQSLDIDPKNVAGYVLGEHGKTAFIPWSLLNIAGMSLEDYCRLHQVQLPNHEQILEDVKQVGIEIFNRKGNTNHGIAASVFRIVQALTVSEHSILPVGVLLQGEYGLDDVVLSVPTVIDRHGIARIIKAPLTEQEMQQLHASGQFIQDLISEVKEHFRYDNESK